MFIYKRFTLEYLYSVHLSNQEGQEERSRMLVTIMETGEEDFW